MPKRKSDATESDAAVPELRPNDEPAIPDQPAEPGAYEPAVTVTADDGATGPADAPEPYRDPVPGIPADATPAEPAAVIADEPRPRPPAPPAPPVEDAHDQDEEAGGSLAGKLLTALLLLLLGAGLALWGAPRLAPHLPSGMSGLADWLSPGTRDAGARVAELEARLGARVDAVEGRLGGLASAEDVDARVASAVDAAAGRLDAEIAVVKATAAEASAGAGQLPQQLARLQSTIEGQGAEMATLKQQLSGAEAAGGQLSQEALGRIDVYRAELEGLRAEVGTLQDKVAGLATALDQAVKRADREVETAQARVAEIETAADTRLSAAEAEANLALIRAALESGGPFEAPLAALQGRAGVAVPQGLVDAAPTGVESMARLRDGFGDAAHAAIRSSMMASAGDGLMSRTRAFFGAQVASRSLTPQQGSSPDAVLSRAEDRLRQGDLDAALAEVGALPSEAQAAMASWLAAARLRAAAADGLAALESALPATN